MHRAAQLRVIAEVSSDGNTWATVQDAATVLKQFPDEGLVSWIDPPPDVASGSLWQFDVMPQPSYRDKPYPTQKRDFYKVRETPVPAVEILDLRDAGDGDALRDLVTCRGIDVPPDLSKACFRLGGEWWIEGVPLIPASEGAGLKIVPESFVKHTLYRVRWFPHHAILEVDINGRKRRFLAPKAHPTGERQAFEWTPNDRLLHDVLQRVKTELPELQQIHPVINQAVEKVALYVAKLSSGPGLQIWENRLERARKLVAEINGHEGLLKLVVDELLGQPGIKDELEARKRRILEDESKRVKDSLAEEAAKVEEKRALLRDLDRRIAERREQQASLLDRLDATLEGRFQEIAARPERFLAEVTLLRSILSHQAAEGTAQERWLPAGSSSANEITTYDQLKPTLTQALSAQGLLPVLGRLVHATLLAGLVPLVDGLRASDLLRAYASCVTGGGITWIPITTGLVDARDLFTRQSFGDLLRRVAATKSMHLVVLDGVNRAASELVLIPLLEAYGDAWRLACRPLPGERLDDPASGWPRNVLLAATLSEGSLTFPLPASVWRQATLLHCNQLPDSAIPLTLRHPDLLYGQLDSQSVHLVTAETWVRWRKTALEIELDPVAKAWERTPLSHGPNPAVQEACLRLFATSRLWPTNPHEAMADVADVCLVPALAGTGDAIQWLDAAIQQPRNWDWLLAAARPYVGAGVGHSG